MLIPILGSRVRAIVKDEVGSLEKVLDARLEAVGAKIDLEKWFPTVQDMAEVKARPALVEGRISAQAGPSGKPWPHGAKRAVMAFVLLRPRASALGRCRNGRRRSS